METQFGVRAFDEPNNPTNSVTLMKDFLILFFRHFFVSMSLRAKWQKSCFETNKVL